MPRPRPDEAAQPYWTYIDRITSDDITTVIDQQLEETLAFLRGISEPKSLYRYAPGKWSIREVWSHVNDSERVFQFRAFWFARGFDTPLPSFDQDRAAEGTPANEITWARHMEEFRWIRGATAAFFRQLPEEAWTRTGVASGYPFTVNSLAYLVAGHVAHHRAMLEERYVR